MIDFPDPEDYTKKPIKNHSKKNKKIKKGKKAYTGFLVERLEFLLVDIHEGLLGTEEVEAIDGIIRGRDGTIPDPGTTGGKGPGRRGQGCARGCGALS